MANEPMLDLELDDEILELTDIVVKGQSSVPSVDPEKDFGADLDALLMDMGIDNSMVKPSVKPRPVVSEILDSTPAKGPAPTDHEVNPDEELALPDLDDLDALLAQLGAETTSESKAKPGEGAQEPAGFDELDAITIPDPVKQKNISEQAAGIMVEAAEISENSGIDSELEDVLSMIGEDLPSEITKNVPAPKAASLAHNNATTDAAADLMAELGISSVTPEETADFGVDMEPAQILSAATVSPEDDLLAELGIEAPQSKSTPAPTNSAANDAEANLLAELGISSVAPEKLANVEVNMEPAQTLSTATVSPEDDLLAELGIEPPQPKAAPAAEDAHAPEDIKEQIIKEKIEMVESAETDNSATSGIDLNELDALLDTMLASAPVSGPLPSQPVQTAKEEVSEVTSTEIVSGIAESDGQADLSSTEMPELAVETVEEEPTPASVAIPQVLYVNHGAEIEELKAHCEKLESDLAGAHSDIQNLKDELVVLHGIQAEIAELHASIDKHAAAAAARILREEIASLVEALQ